jgi:vacuolar protein sorting-associated protein 13A/C
LNLSDRKYRAFNKTLSFISYSISAPVADLVAVTIAEAAPVEWDISYASPELGADDFFDAEEEMDVIKLDMSRVESPVVFTKEEDMEKMSRTVIEFTFQVGEVSVSLQKTDESTLVELNIYEFGLTYVSRPFDYKAVIHIADAQIVDCMQTDREFRYLLSKAAGVVGEEKFISIVYDSINRESPEFKGTDQAADISFGGLLNGVNGLAVDIVLTRASILSLYDFVLTTFTDSNASTPSEEAMPNPVIIEAKPTDRTFAVSLSMKTINFLLNKDGTHLATASFDDGLISVMMQLDSMSVHGTLGNINVVDQMVRGSDLFRSFMRLEGGDAADFTFETYGKGAGWPGYDSILSLRCPSLKVTHLEEFTRNLQVWF